MGCAGSTPDKAPVYKAQEPATTKPTVPTPVVDPADIEPEEVAMPTLSGEKKKQVMEVFKLFDVKDDGKIPLKQLRDAGMKVGGTDVKILSTLADMDFNGDGYVEASEWELYFATVSADLSDEELKLVMDDLRTAGSDMVTVYQCTLMAEAAEAAPVEVADAEAVAEAAEALAQTALEGKQKALVEGLFKAWDFNGDGGIDRTKLQTTGVEVGPRKAKVFADFELMDVNNDNIVELHEMLQYFGVAASLMSEDEFEATIEEMREVAEAEKSVSDMLKLASEDAAAPVSIDDDEEAPEPPPELTPARRTQVDELFTAFSPDTATPIDLATLVASGTVENGPAKTNLLEGLQAMDANGDGKVEHSEMVFYFTFIGQTLSDPEFDVVLADLKDKAATGMALKAANQ